MSPFDDRQPEEKDPQYEELITLLQKANLDPMLVDPQERAHILSQARARLFPTVSQPADMPIPALSELGSFPSKPKTLADKPQRGRRLLHLLNMLAAVLVVAALIGASLLLFGLWSPLQRDRSSGPVVVASAVFRTQAHGLEMIMQVTPGPYFLSEMLAVHLSLTNHTQTTFLLQGPECDSPLKVVVTGGKSPNDTHLKSNLAAMASCVGASGLGLNPAQTITAIKYVAITSSGHVTLTAQAGYHMSIFMQGAYHLDPTATLFVERVLSWQLTVQTQVPSDRLIPVHQQGSQVIIDAPPAARDQLLYEEVSDCTRNGVYRYPGTLRWETLSTTTMHPPDCATLNLNFNGGTGTSPLKFLWWKYVVGSPGYATISGNYP